MTTAAPSGSGMRTRLSARMIGLSRKSSRTARTIGSRNARAKNEGVQHREDEQPRDGDRAHLQPIGQRLLQLPEIRLLDGAALFAPRLELRFRRRGHIRPEGRARSRVLGGARNHGLPLMEEETALVRVSRQALRLRGAGP